MATYHCSVKVGGKGKASGHAAYIAREGRYAEQAGYEDLEATGYGNMPAWAEDGPALFWSAADRYERANGATYREIEIALPRELNPAQRQALMLDFIRQEIGARHAHQWAIHNPGAALAGENNRTPTSCTRNGRWTASNVTPSSTSNGTTGRIPSEGAAGKTAPEPKSDCWKPGSGGRRCKTPTSSNTATRRGWTTAAWPTRVSTGHRSSTWAGDESGNWHRTSGKPCWSGGQPKTNSPPNAWAHRQPKAEWLGA